MIPNYCHITFYHFAEEVDCVLKLPLYARYHINKLSQYSAITVQLIGLKNYLLHDLCPALEALLDARGAIAAGDPMLAGQEDDRRLRLLRAPPALDRRV